MSPSPRSSWTTASKPARTRRSASGTLHNGLRQTRRRVEDRSRTFLRTGEDPNALISLRAKLPSVDEHQPNSVSGGCWAGTRFCRLAVTAFALTTANSGLRCRDDHALSAPHVPLSTFRSQSRAGKGRAHDRGAAAHPRRRGHGEDARDHRARGVSPREEWSRRTSSR